MIIMMQCKDGQENPWCWLEDEEDKSVVPEIVLFCCCFYLDNGNGHPCRK